jgi:F0F1-type ATP synthase delta subunit
MIGLEKTYARALWELLQKGEKPKEAVTKIHAALQQKGRAALMPAVGKAFERLAQREAQKNRSVLVVARKSDESRARRESGAKEAELSVDESIIGGWQLFDRGVLKDESWKSALLSIYNGATRS